ncbi:PstS family phosphate ABC transporter substrate-binding protein [Pelomonas sp. KK5]|uniref:PstS family phosphate ABC transporter substrate-binding protein n=1 Tax=Pelomonas sp. KK5 TaxID=1855730 RepID=UPI00097BC985|nr:substrate-binding domain-containing protein [Pelomonas sp. KK5]
MKTAITLACLALLATAAAQAQEQTESGQAAIKAKNARQSIWTLDVTKFRKEHAVDGGYKKQWDLSDLPHYVPRQQVSGTLKIWGSNYLKDGPLGGYWAEGFRKFQPGITIEYNLPTAGIAIPGVAGKVADLGVGRPATLMDHLTFEQVYRFPITEITAATGSYDVYGWSPGFIILVHKSNPLTQISMKQLDGVFGTAREGGYDKSTWRTDYPYKRGAGENLRTWGQLGLKGEWADKPIHPCGQSPRANIQTVFQNLVLYGSDQWVEGYRSYANYATPEGKINPWSKQVLAALESDPLSICIASPLTVEGKNVRELAIQGRDGGPAVMRTLETVRDRSYPLINEIFFYGVKAPGKRMEPKVEEFLRYVLSQEGQNEIQREGRYTPLTGAVVKAQLQKLEEGAN